MSNVYTTLGYRDIRQNDVGLVVKTKPHRPTTAVCRGRLVRGKTKRVVLNALFGCSKRRSLAFLGKRHGLWNSGRWCKIWVSVFVCAQLK